MTTRMISEVLAFNQQIKLLLDAGVPIVVGNAMSPKAIRQLLDSIDARMQNAKESNTPEPSESEPNLPESSASGRFAFLDTPDIDPSYRLALDSWRKKEGSVSAFDCFYELGVAKRKSRWSIADAVLPSLILGLVLIPASYFLLFRVYPDIDSMYKISNVKPTQTMLQLLELRNPISGLALWCIPLLLLFAFLLYIRVPNLFVKFFPGYRRYSSSLLGIQNLESTPTHLSHSFTKLAWENKVAHEDNLTVRWFPIVVSTIVCGTIVAFYAILLFWPLTHLLEQLSAQSGVVS